jgi:SAM-dependent methyltransferase
MQAVATGSTGYADVQPPQQVDFAYYDESYFYGAGYRDYDRESPPHKLEFYSRLIERAVRNVDHPRVLDVGCAFGRLLAGLPKYFDRVGTEVSSYALEQARRFVTDVRFVEAELPPASLGTFDAISAFDVLEQVTDPRAMLARLASLLEPGGEFITVIPVYDGVFGWPQRLLNARAIRRHQLSRRAWLSLIGDAFEIVEWKGIYRFLAPGGWFYVHTVTRALRGSAPAIVVRARAKG